MRSLAIGIAVLLGLFVSGASAADKLLQSSDLSYVGAFRVPNANGQFSYGGRPVAFNAANNSLFIGSANNEANGREGIAEITIPAPVNSSNLSGLNTASLRQNFVNAFNGNLNSIEPLQGAMFAGILPYESKLIVSGYGYYDANMSATKSHASINANWTANGLGYSGLVTVGAPPAKNVGYTGGYMCPIPPAWQSALGGTALTGNSNVPIITRTSFGPAAFAFNPAQVGVTNPVPAVALLYYDKNGAGTCDSTHWTLGCFSGVNDVIGGSDMIDGVVFPDGSKTVLFIGRHGETYCYGTGAECNDPDVTDKGTHGYPYRYRVWAYNADDLAAVKAGTKNPWDVVPYAYWNLTFPIMGWKSQVGGATYDPATRRLYISIDHGDGSAPLIHVMSVNVDPVNDTTPPTVSLSAPGSGSTVTGTVSVTANATDSTGISKIEFYVNGTLQTTDTSTPYLYSWDTSPLAAGSYTLMAKAYDAAGNIGQSTTVTVSVVKDTTPPAAAMTSPANNATINGTVSIAANASDAVGVAMVEFYANGALLSATNVTPYRYNWNTTPVPNGNYTLTAKAYDAAGNVGQTANVAVTVNNSASDTTPPTVTAFALPATATSTTVNVSFTATDNIAVNGYCITETNSSTGCAWTSSAPATYTFSGQGLKTAYAWAKDAAGNISSSLNAAVTISSSYPVNTADPAASDKTRALYNYLYNLPNETSNRILSGQYVENTTDMTGINTKTGKYPALMGMDYAWNPVSDSYIISWANAGGIVTVGYHFKNPVTGRLQNSDGSFDTTNVDLAQVITNGTALNTAFKADLDKLATHLIAFQNANVPVILRVFHEQNGGWFWWGARDATQFKNLWKYTFNYLTTTKGLHNLIWNFSPYQGPDSGPINTTYYPGTQYVDMVGVSVYYSGNNIPAITNIPDNKPVAINEWGYHAGGQTYNTSSYPPADISGMIARLKANTPKAVYWMAWNGIYSMNYNTGTSALLADPWVATRDEVPALGTSDTTPPTVSITSPAANATVNGTISVTAAATDNAGISKVEFYVNGTLQATDTSAPYSYSWDTSTLATGSYTLMTKVYDAAGNVGQSSNVSVMVSSPTPDTIPPSVPANLTATAVSQSQVNLSWTASTDNVGVTGYRIFRNGTQVGSSTVANYQDTSLSANTGYTYAVAAYDAASNASAQSASATATTQQNSSGGATVGSACNVADLPISGTRIINVSSETQLQSAISNAQPGDTIVLADGTYNLTSSLYLNGKDNVTIRGNSGCDNVVLSGKGMDNINYGAVDVGIWSNAKNTTIAHLTIRDTYDNSIVFNSGAQSPRVYSVKLLNAGSQFIKSNPTDVTNGIGVDNAVVEYTWFEYTNGTPNHTGNVGYFNGISAHSADNWSIRGNMFKNLHAPDSADWQWNPAVLVWNHSTNTTTENNTFINVDRAIAYGLQDISGSDHSGGVIRNNLVYLAPNLMSATRKAGSDAAILVWDSPSSLVYHNTVLTNGNLNSSIEFRFATPGAEARNNLTDAPVSVRNSGTYAQSGNFLSATASMFVDPASGNLHLLDNTATRANVIDKVAPLSSVPKDLDGDSRPAGSNADVGADEFVPANDTSAPATAVTSPTAGSSVSGSVSVAAAASDSVGVTKVEFYVDGALKATDTTNSYGFTLDTTTLPNGSHTITTKAYDAAGNIGQSAVVTVTVANTVPDTTAPVTAITAPAAGASVSGAVTVTASATDSVGVTKVEFYVNGVLKATDTASPYSFSWNTTTATNGAATLTTKAYDAAGNVGQSAGRSVTVNNDTAAPTVTAFTIPATASSLTVAITSFTASDNVAVTGYMVTETSAPPTSGSTGWSSTPQGTYTTTTEGSKTLYAWAKDAAGNVSVVKSAPVVITLPKTYYVSPVGSDTNTCSQSAPCRNISKPLTMVKAGDTVLVADGTYQGLDVTGINGTAQAPITIKAQGSAAYLGKRANGIGNLFLNNCSYIIFDGIKM